VFASTKIDNAKLFGFLSGCFLFVASSSAGAQTPQHDSDYDRIIVPQLLEKVIGYYNHGDYGRCLNEVKSDGLFTSQEANYYYVMSFVKLNRMIEARRCFDQFFRDRSDPYAQKIQAVFDEIDPPLKIPPYHGAKVSQIGVALKQNVVAAVAPDSPAFKIGVLPGDKIVAVEGVRTEQASSGEIIRRLTKLSGATVPFVIERGGRRYATQASCTDNSFDYNPVAIAEPAAAPTKITVLKQARQTESLATSGSSSSVDSSVDRRFERRDEFVTGLNENPSLSGAAYKAVEHQLDMIPPTIRHALKEAGYIIVLTPTLLAAVPEASSAVPPGHASDTNYDNISGLFLRDNKRILIAEQRQSKVDGKYYQNMMLGQAVKHEVGHAYDDYLGSYSSGDDFSNAFEKDGDRLREQDKSQLSYYLQPGTRGRSELFASMFDVVYTPDPERLQSQRDLMKAFPKVYELMTKSLSELVRTQK
jgi:hypothetical protein